MVLIKEITSKLYTIIIINIVILQNTILNQKTSNKFDFYISDN